MEQMILQDICKVYDCPHTTAKDEGIGIPLVRTPNIGKGRLLLTNAHRVNSDIYQERTRRAIPEEDDIIIAREAPVGNAAIIQMGQKVCLGQRVVLLKPIRDRVDPNYLVYYLLSDEIQHRLRIHANGAVVAHLNMADIRNLPVSLPSLSEQKKIGRVLKIIDDKIELNRRINDNLEQQAQALFKSWFVDFEPFKDGKFVESEIGMIPEGWKVGKLEDIADVVGGGTPSKANALYFDKQCIPWITPKDLSIKKTKFISKGEIDITEEGYKNSSAKKIPLGSVLFSSRAPIGYISIAENELTTNQGFKSVVPVKAGTSFLYLYLKANTKAIEAQATGSTFKEASGSLMKSLCVIIPPDTVFDSFERNAFPFFSAQANVEREIVNLSKARDTLLPRLMSGELKINDLNC